MTDCLSSPGTLPMPHLFAALDAAIESYIARMPSLRGQGLLHPGLASGSSSVNHQVIFIRTLGFTSSLVLHQHATDNFSHSRCGTASHYLASIISAMTPADYGSVFIGLGVRFCFARPPTAISLTLGCFHTACLVHCWSDPGHIEPANGRTRGAAAPELRHRGAFSTEELEPRIPSPW